MLQLDSRPNLRFHFQLPIANCQLPIANCQLPIADSQIFVAPRVLPSVLADSGQRNVTLANAEAAYRTLRVPTRTRIRVYFFLAVFSFFPVVARVTRTRVFLDQVYMAGGSGGRLRGRIRWPPTSGLCAVGAAVLARKTAQFASRFSRLDAAPLLRQ